MEDAKANLAKSEATLNEKKAVYDNLTKLHDEADTELNTAKATLEEKQKAYEEIKATADSITEEDLAKAEADIESAKTAVNEAKAKADDLKSRLDKAGSELNDAQTTYNACKQAYDTAVSKEEQAKADKAQAEADAKKKAEEEAKKKEEADKASTNSSEANKELDKVKEENPDAEKKLEDATNESNKANQEADKAKEDADKAQETVDGLTSEHDKLTQDKTKADADKKNAETEFSNTTANKNDASTNLSNAQAGVSSAQGKVDNALNSEEVKQAQAEYAKQQQIVEEKNKDLKNANTQVSNAQEEVDKLTAEKNNLETQINAKQSEIDKAKANLQTSLDRLETHRKYLATDQAQLDKYLADMTTLQKQIEDEQAKINKLTKEIAALQKQAENNSEALEKAGKEVESAKADVEAKKQAVEDAKVIRKEITVTFDENGNITTPAVAIPQYYGATDKDDISFSVEEGASSWDTYVATLYASKIYNTKTVTPYVYNMYLWDAGNGMTMGSGDINDVPEGKEYQVEKTVDSGTYTINANWYDVDEKGNRVLDEAGQPIKHTQKIVITVKGGTYNEAQNQAKAEFKEKVDNIAENVIDHNDSLNDEQKFWNIANYVCGTYGYGKSYTAEGMLNTGTGDCWASTELIREIVTRYGYDSIKFSCNFLPMSASGHANALVYSPENDKYYMLEAGYQRSQNSGMHGDVIDLSLQGVADKANRFLYGLPSEDKASYLKNTIGFWYGFEDENIVIPETSSDGTTITTIGMAGSWKTFESPFAQCTKVKSITIPKTVTSIAKEAFLTQFGSTFRIIVDEENPNYCSDEAGCLYVKNADGSRGEKLYTPISARPTQENTNDVSDEQWKANIEKANNNLSDANTTLQRKQDAYNALTPENIQNSLKDKQKEFDEANDRLNKAKFNYAQTSTKKNEWKNIVKTDNDNIDKYTADITTYQGKISSLTDEQNQLKTAKDKAEIDITVKEQAVKDAQDVVKEKEKAVNDAKAVLKDKEEAVKTAGGEALAKANAELEDAKTKLAQAQADLDIANKNFDSAKAKKELADETFDIISNSLDEVTAKLSRAQTDLSSKKGLLARALDNKSKKQKELDKATENAAALTNAKNKAEEAKKVLDEANKQLGLAQKATQDANTTLAQKQSALEEAERNVEAAKKAYDEAKADLDATELAYKSLDEQSQDAQEALITANKAQRKAEDKLKAMNDAIATRDTLEREIADLEDQIPE